MLDLSVGGFSIGCEEFAPTDSRCRLVVAATEGQAFTVSARVEWQRKTPDGYILGCAYLEPDAHRIMERTIGRQFAMANAGAAAAASAPASLPEARQPARSLADPVRRDSARHAARKGQRTLLAALLAMGGSLALLSLGQDAGPLGWNGAAVALFAAAGCTFLYHRLTRQVLVRAACQSGRV